MYDLTLEGGTRLPCAELGPCLSTSAVALEAAPRRPPAFQRSYSSQMQGNTFSVVVLFFLESLFLGPTDSGGRGGDRNHIPSVHLTFIAHCHRRVWGSLAILPHHHCVCRGSKNKNLENHKNKFFFKKKKDSSPGLYFKFPKWEAPRCAWGSPWAHRVSLSSPALQCGRCL